MILSCQLITSLFLDCERRHRNHGDPGECHTERDTRPADQIYDLHAGRQQCVLTSAPPCQPACLTITRFLAFKERDFSREFKGSWLVGKSIESKLGTFYRRVKRPVQKLVSWNLRSLAFVQGKQFGHLWKGTRGAALIPLCTCLCHNHTSSHLLISPFQMLICLHALIITPEVAAGNSAALF